MSCTLYAQYGQPPATEDSPEVRTVKDCIADRNIDCEFVDAKRQREVFNRFYRCHKPEIRRTEEGIRFPVFHDGMVVQQGGAPILAYVLSGYGLEGCIEDAAAEGVVGGLYPSRCPSDQEAHFQELVGRLVRGGCQVHLLAERSGAHLVARLLGIGAGVEASLVVPGDGVPEDDKEFAELVGVLCEHPGAALQVRPMRDDGDRLRWPSERSVAEAVGRICRLRMERSLPLRRAFAGAEAWDRGMPAAEGRYMAACRQACAGCLGENAAT
jgi:hypothetical protein